jgi:hypothetical protein
MSSVGSSATSVVGTWITTTATNWLVYRLTGSAVLLGTVAFASQLLSEGEGDAYYVVEGRMSTPSPCAARSTSFISKLEWFRRGGETLERQWTDEDGQRPPEEGRLRRPASAHEHRATLSSWFVLRQTKSLQRWALVNPVASVA